MKREDQLGLKVLWLSPNLNHYKARFLSHFGNNNNIDLTVLSGTGRKNKGDQNIDEQFNFKEIKLDVSKQKFGVSKIVRNTLKSLFDQFDWVLIPAEKKNLLLFLFTLKLKRRSRHVKIFSYNHPVFKSKNGRITTVDKALTKFFYNRLDVVIFYTKESFNWAIQNKLVSEKKARWANNTIDTIEIDKYFKYQLPPRNQKTIVFIGRLIPSKRIDLLFQYYKALKKLNSDLELEIIGDGPDAPIVQSALKEDSSITWHGVLVDESRIAPIMSKASMVFIPGHSGLSVNHAFVYGRPYITLKGPSHAPEVNYIDHGQNGYVLQGDFDSNIKTIHKVLTEPGLLESFSESARKKGRYLSVNNWVDQMTNNLLNEN